MCNNGFMTSFYGGECRVDCFIPIEKINLNKIVGSIIHRDNLENIIVIDITGCVIFEYHVDEDCFSFIPKKTLERIIAYELRELYNRYKKIKSANCANGKIIQ